LVRHPTEVEWWWFRIHAGGENAGHEYCTKERPDADADKVDAADAQANLDAFRREIEAAKAAVRGRPLDDVVPSRGAAAMSR
jgi:Protein of unknown function (DUF664)